MEKTNALTLIITLVVGVILAGSVLGPVITDAQKNIGDSYIATNTSTTVAGTDELFVTEDISGTHTFSAEYPNAYVTIDDVQIATSTAKQGFYIISDGVSVFNTGAFFAVSFGNTSAQYSPAWNVDLSITWEDGEATFTYRDGGTTNTYTTNYTWIGYRVAEGGNYVNKVSSATANFYDMTNFIAMGNYTTGDNDTFYVLKDGKVTLSNTTYSGSVTTFNTSDITGTTDLHNGTLRIYVDDEYFTPYVWAVKKTVEGHESGGAPYSLLGAIPILLIVALLMLAVGAIAYRRAD